MAVTVQDAMNNYDVGSDNTARITYHLELVEADVEQYAPILTADSPRRDQAVLELLVLSMRPRGVASQTDGSGSISYKEYDTERSRILNRLVGLQVGSTSQVK